jgi:hypothetical protein
MLTCFYTTCDPIIVGCKLYTTNSATAFVTDGFYSDGADCYQVVSGIVTDINPCAVAPSCISWEVQSSETIGENTKINYIDCTTGLPAEVNVGYNQASQTICASSITGAEGNGAVINNGPCGA